MLKDWNRGEIDTRDVFHFVYSLRPFILVNYHDEDLFIDINEGSAYTFEDLESESLYFFSKEDDEDFKGVHVISKICY